MRFILMLSLTLTLSGCGWGSGKDYHLDEHSFDTDSIKLIQEKTDITFPAGYRGIHLFYRDSTIDPAFLAKVEIPASEHEAFAKQIEEISDKGGRITSSITKKVPWWNPPKKPLVERIFNHDMNGVRVIFCKEGEQWILYVMWIKV